MEWERVRGAGGLCSCPYCGEPIIVDVPESEPEAKEPNMLDGLFAWIRGDRERPL